ncbi:MAG: hypothetical protein K6G76_09600 [Lachnospiraceae bacterium]|nr:hypothetical protein [Lachnospiraceae bacterium]
MKKSALVIGIVGIICISNMLPANAVGVDINSEISDTTNIESIDNEETSADSESDTADETQNDSGDIWQNGESVTESTEEFFDIDNINEQNIQSDTGINTDTDVAIVDSLNISTNGEISYYLNMKRYEMLLTYYQKMDELLLRKTEIYQKLAESGDITDITVKQIATQEKQVASQKDICCNEVDYNRYIISKTGVSFDDVDIKSIKNVEDIEYYTAGKTKYSASNIARYVTDCKNAVSNISAKEAEIETLMAINEQVNELKKAGEMSELDVIDSKLAVLKSQIELEDYYYEMNVNYYCLLK